jgi:hypothetical protein
MRIAIRLSIISLFSILAGAASAAPPALLSHWVQLAPGGSAEARIVLQGDTCPAATIDGASAAMRVRAASDKNFPVLLCAVTLPAGAKRLSILGADMPLPNADPQRIVVLGDTGCRIKGSAVQACNDPAKWEFPEIAAAAAKLKPDLVIHVGDYLYRESPCPGPDAGCTGTPWGDNWNTWAADFFAPAAPLLAAAPWVIVRGNHEDCTRSGPGWLRLLGPLAVDTANCVSHIAPYPIPLKPMNLIVLDDADASDVLAPSDQVAVYRGDFESLAKLAPAPSWLVMHRPIWGVVKGPMGMVLGGNSTMMAAVDGSGIAPNIALLLAGHIHTFEAINYEKGAPPQILAGEGGDLLDPAPADLTGQSVGSMKITSGLSLPGYGFLLFTHAGNVWTVDVRAADGSHERTCAFASGHIECAKK